MILSQVIALLWLRQNFKAVSLSYLTVLKCSGSSVTHWKTSFWSLNAVVFWRLLCCCCLMVVFSFLLCLRICMSLVLWRRSHQLASAVCSFLLIECKQTVLQYIDGGGIFQERGLGQTSCMVNEQAVSLALLSCLDLKNNLPFVRFQKLLSLERQNSHLFSWRARAHLSSFLLQAHSWAFSSPCPKLTARIPSCCNFQDHSFMLLTPALDEMLHGAIQPL